MIILDEDQSQISPITERSPLTVSTKGSEAAGRPITKVSSPPPYFQHNPYYQSTSHSHHHHQSRDHDHCGVPGHPHYPHPHHIHENQHGQRRGSHAHRHHHEPASNPYGFNLSLKRFFKAVVTAFAILVLVKFLIWSIVVVSTPLQGRNGHWAIILDKIMGTSEKGVSLNEPTLSNPATQVAPPVASQSTWVLPSMRIIRHLPVDYPVPSSSSVPSPSLN